MPERWQRELEKWGDVEAPERMRARIDDGAKGDGMPPNPSRSQRVLAGVVAFAVFGVAAALALGAFGRRSEPAVGTTSAPIVVGFGRVAGAPAVTFALADRSVVVSAEQVRPRFVSFPVAIPVGTTLTVRGSDDTFDVGAATAALVAEDAARPTSTASPPVGSPSWVPSDLGRLSDAPVVPDRPGRWNLFVTFPGYDAKDRFIAVVGVQVVPAVPIAATTVPDLSGLPELVGYQTLVAYGFIPGASQLPGPDPGIVRSTQPIAGSSVDARTSVSMNVDGTIRDNDYSGTSWLDRYVATDPRYIGSYVDAGGIPVAVVGSAQRASVRGDIARIADGRPFFETVCVGVDRPALENILTLLRDPSATPVPQTVHARMFIDPSSCSVAIDDRDVPQTAINRLRAAFGPVNLEDLRGVSAATRG